MEKSKQLIQLIKDNAVMIDMLGDCGHVHFDFGEGNIRSSIAKNSNNKIDTSNQKCYDIAEH